MVERIFPKGDIPSVEQQQQPTTLQHRVHIAFTSHRSVISHAYPSLPATLMSCWMERDDDDDDDQEFKASFNKINISGFAFVPCFNPFVLYHKSKATPYLERPSAENGQITFSRRRVGETPMAAGIGQESRGFSE
ncbi:hypothetical protein M0802_013870 [Mischocyttarus mexicanus]|nr:hypothetical protein M0802_013879 [Mischocyttarus mexicanus]KAI4481889.1 hypothetical protein M0802_013870 [Mischocyttarus mexicanus]